MEESLVDRAHEAEPRVREYRAAATLVGVATAVALFLALRPAPPVIARPAMADPTETIPAFVVVHVAGAVRSPGLYELPPGARIADAIDAAGGARPRADLTLLNLAEVVRDGMQILLTSGGRASALPLPTSSATTVAVDLNLADQSQLETVPGIGPVKAAAILAHRTEIGSFTSLDQLLEISGIGPATLEAIRPYITI